MEQHKFENEAAIRAMRAAPPAERRAMLGAIVEANHGLVCMHLDKIEHWMGYPFPAGWRDDLEQGGRCGLWMAAEKFDPDLGARFCTYAGYWIRREVFRALRFVSSVIDIPKTRPRRPLAPQRPLDAPLGGGEGLPLGVLIVDSGPPPDVLAAYREQADQIAAALAKLPERSHVVLRDYYWRSRTLQAIGDDIGVTRERVRQIKAKAMQRLVADLRAVAA